MNLLKHPVFRRFSLLCLLTSLGVGVGMGYAISALVTRLASQREWQTTAELVQRELEADMLQHVFSDTLEPAARQRWGRALATRLTTLPDVVRVTVWGRGANVVWAPQKHLIGQRFPDNDDLLSALTGQVEVDIHHLSKAEQGRDNLMFRTLAVIYVPIFNPNGGGVLGVVQIHKAPERLLTTLWWSRMVIWVVCLAGGGTLYLVLLPLLMQVYRRQVEDEMLRQHAARLQQEVEQRTQQFMQAQKMQALGLLAGGIAHDFNNMLTVIFGRAQVLLERLPADTRARHDADAIGEAAERATALPRQLLAFSRKQQLERRTLDLNTVVVDMAKMLRRLIGENITVVTALGRAAAWVNVDRGQLEQVILNLAVNARDAMPQGGRLVLSTDTVDSDGAPGAPVPAGRFVRLVVSDTGVGMDAATQERIFEPFFTTKPVGAGTGLGLSTVYGIVEQHGGRIIVDSAPERGTTFTICLPHVDEPAPAEAVAAATLRTGSETILVAEDDPAVRVLAADMLREHGYTVLTSDGHEALRVAERHERHVDLLLTDVMMPHTNGVELASAFASARPDARVLYMTGYAEVPLVSDAVIVHKPFSMVVLLDAVRRALDGATRVEYATATA